jgi:uncharacterized caspase-like protein
VLYAVVIGIDEYEDNRIRNLDHARDDAEKFASRILQNIHPSDRKVVVLLDSAATREAIRIAIGEVLPRATREGDVVIVFFAGHGSPETSGALDETSRYLIAYDTNYESIYATGIDLEEDVTRWFKRVSAPKLMLFFIDACFSGRAGGRTFEGPRLKEIRAKNRSGAVRLNELKLGTGRAILAACDDDQVARETSKLGHGVFTHELLQALSVESADRTISVTELYDRVRERVSSRTAGRQQPVLSGRIVGARMPALPIDD